MKQKQNLYAALAFAALAAVAAPGTADANTTANATIMNVVRVDYKDVSGQNSFAANASAKVTVNLVKTALNPSGAPTGADANPALSCLNFEASSVSTVRAIYAYTATANGQASYALSVISSSDKVTGQTVTFDTLNYTGTVAAASPVVLGSAIPTGSQGADILEFPGGALAGFQTNDIVVVQTAAGKKAFLVDKVHVGSAPDHPNVGNTAHFSTGTLTDEDKGTLTLKAYANQTVTLNTPNDTTFGGGNNAPAFDVPGNGPTLGVPVGEMVLVRMTVTASATLADGSVSYTLTATDGANPVEITCSVPFKAPTLSIMKQARNASDGGSFGATASGNPGQFLEYRVTVSNEGGQAAQVTVADAVPSYTTLVTHGTYGDRTGTGFPANVIAQVTDSAANSLSLTMDGTDSEIQPLAPTKSGFGKATAVAAGSPITFYLGDASTNAQGGKLPYCSNNSFTSKAACEGANEKWITQFTILYQVKID